MSPTELSAWACLKCLQAVLIFRIAQLRLFGKFPCFATYLILSLFSSAVLFTVGQQRYDTGWIWLTPALLFALMLTAFEAHWKIQQHCRPLQHPNIATAIMVGVSAFVAWITLEAHAWTSRFKPAFFGIRYTAGVLAIWMMWHATWAPRIEPPLPHNLLAHVRILAVLLFIQAGVFAVINLLSANPPYAPRILLNVLNLGGQALCCCAWILAFRRER